MFHGWWIVVGTWAMQALQGSLFFLSFGAYADQLQAHFGWSRTSISGAFALARVESGLLGPLQGWSVDRFGPMLNIRVGVVLFGAGFMLMSAIQTLWHFYAAFLLLAVGASLAGFLTLNTAVANWFIRKRARAMGIAQTGLGFGGGALVILVAWMLQTLGWRQTFLIAGIAILAIGLPLSSLFVHRPEDRGQLPDGAAKEEREPGAGGGARFGENDFLLREAVRDRSFWFISIGHGAALLVVSSIQVHLVLHLRDLGWSLTSAASLVTALTLTSTLGQLGGGFLGDRYSKRMLAAACMLGHALGMLALAYATAPVVIVAAALVHGLAWGTRGPLMTAIRADYYGRRNFAKVMGVSSLVVQLGTVAGPLLAGFLFDQTGSYQLPFTILGAATGLSAVFFLLARPPRRRSPRHAPNQAGARGER